MNVDGEKRINCGMGPETQCSMPQFVAQFRPPFDRTKDEDPLKVERNKLAGRIVASYVPQAWTEVIQNPLYHALTSEPSKTIDDKFKDKTTKFYILMYETLNDAMRNEILRRASLLNTDLEKMELMRLLSLPPFNRKESSPLSEIIEFFTYGNGTAIQTPAKLIRVIPDVFSAQYRTEPSKAETLQIARNSFPTVDQIMLMHLEDHSVLMRGLQNEETKMLDPMHFVIEDDALKVRKDSVQAIFSRTTLPPHSSARTGCITRFERVNNGESDQRLAKDFFDRFLNVVEKL